MKICQEVKPDFCFSLHNAMIGGAFFYINHDFGNPLYKNLYKLLKSHKIPLHLGEAEIAFSKVFAPAIYESLSARNFYNYLETLRPDPENAINRGAGTYEYLSKFNNSSVSFYCELPYVKHPDISSKEISLENRGKLLLRNAQEYAYFMNSLGMIWSEIKNIVDTESPFYEEPKSKFENWISTDGDYNNILKNKSIFEINATRGQVLDLNQMTYYHLCNNRSLVRLLQETLKSRKKFNQRDREILKRNLVKVNALYDELMNDISKRLDFKTLEAIDLTSLVRVQLGAGLEVLNAILKN